MADSAPALDDAAAKAAEMDRKREEIVAKVAAMKLAQKKEEEQKTMYFGEHPSITCDGCGAAIFGYRYKCKQCPNHDVCETCYDSWAGGKGAMANELKKQVISANAADHEFSLYKDKHFTSLVKGSSAPTKAAPKTKPNDPCPCGNGKKYKKCCGK